MTEVLQSSPSHFPSPSSSSSTTCAPNDIPHQQQQQSHTLNPTTTRPLREIDQEQVQEEAEEDRSIEGNKEREREGDQLSLLALLIAAFRRSIVGCNNTATGSKELCKMEIGLPSNVRHVAHVTFDRFNGFLGLPVEFEPEVPRRAPSARSVLK